MARPPVPLIALVGAAVLVVAVGAAALRSPDEGISPAQPTAGTTDTELPTDAGLSDTATTEPTPSPTTPAPTPSGSDQPLPDDTEATDTSTVGDDAADDGIRDDGADGDTDDGGIALGPTGEDVQETPNTGGGAATALGAMVAVGAVVAGRRPHG